MDRTDNITPAGTTPADSAPQLQEAAQRQRARSPQGQALDSSPYFGFVDTLDAEQGLRGWVAGPDPRQPVLVSLVAGEFELARVVANISRNDIWTQHQPEFCTGFAFEMKTLAVLLEKADVRSSELLKVQVADTQFCLNTQNKWSWAELVAVVRKACPEKAIEAKLATHPVNQIFQQLTQTAHRALLPALLERATETVGEIEYLGLLAANHIILGGWWQADVAKAHCAVLTSRQLSTAAGVLAMTFERQDIEPGRCGFIAVAQLDEALPLSGTEIRPILTLGLDQTRVVPSHPTLKVLSHDTAMSKLSRLAENAGHPEALAILEYARSIQPWTRGQSPDSTGVNIYVDNFFVLPAFGIFVSGWALSPMGIVTDIAAQVDGSTCHMESDTLNLYPRTDVANAFPAMADRVKHAGFSAILRGHAKIETNRKWLLRVRLSSQATHFAEIDPSRIRLIDQEFDLSLLDDNRFNLSEAPWLQDFAEAINRPSTRVDKPEPWQTAVPGSEWAETALVQVLPETPHGQRMALDQLASHVKGWNGPQRTVVLLTSRYAQRGPLQSWLPRLRQTAPNLHFITASLPPDANAWQFLPSLLSAIHAKKFLFLGPEVVLSSSGAAAVPEVLDSELKPPTFLAIEQLCGRDVPSITRGGQAFAWNNEDFQRYRQTCPPIIIDFGGRNGMNWGRAYVDLPLAEEAHAFALGGTGSKVLFERLNKRIQSLALRTEGEHP